ncbi:hypothetical protein NEAUS07_1970 [Nematocida ausubeli]|nr:hypothetical protein NEAUS07_1970 [Nematocida ausubeli]
MEKSQVIELFKESSIEGLSSLSKEEKKYFWLQTRLLGWRIEDSITIDTVYNVYTEAVKNHRKIMELIRRSDKKLLLHHLQANLTEIELSEVLEHIYNK